MNTKEIREKIDELQNRIFNLEEEYENNGGEETDYTIGEEEEIKALQELIESEGVDTLGRIIKGKEDLKTSLKAEKDFLTRQIEKIDRGIDYFKSLLARAMKATGNTDIKGTNGYKFSLYVSQTTSVDKNLLKEKYEQKISDILMHNLIPGYITIKLDASVTKAQEGVLPEDEELFVHSEKETCKFTKPRAKKEA